MHKWRLLVPRDGYLKSILRRERSPVLDHHLSDDRVRCSSGGSVHVLHCHVFVSSIHGLDSLNPDLQLLWRLQLQQGLLLVSLVWSLCSHGLCACALFEQSMDRLRLTLVHLFLRLYDPGTPSRHDAQSGSLERACNGQLPCNTLLQLVWVLPGTFCLRWRC